MSGFKGTPPWLLALGVMMVCTVAAFWGFTHRTVASTTTDPTGKYTAVTSYRTCQSLLPMMPGSGSDKPCFVKIVDSTGFNCGEIPVPMLQMVQVEWRANGAEVKLIGEWDFAGKTCYYWSEDGNEKIYVRGE